MRVIRCGGTKIKEDRIVCPECDSELGYEKSDVIFTDRDDVCFPTKPPYLYERWIFCPICSNRIILQRG